MLTPQRIRELVRREDPIILDIGSNDGEHTQMFLDLFPYARVYAFEPEPRAIELWKQRISDPRASLIEKVVSHVDGAINFHQSDGRPHPQWTGDSWHYSGSIHRPKHHLKQYPWCRFDRMITVQSLTLDSMGLDRVDFIWADVQGAERDLIAGGLETLERTRFFYTEYNDREMYEGQITLDGIQQLLPNFVVEQVFPDDVLLRHR